MKKKFDIKLIAFSFLFSRVILVGVETDGASQCTKIKIVCTAALIDYQYELRKQEYIRGIEAIKRFGYMPYVVESYKTRPTFLDLLSDKVWYAKNDDTGLRNKGVKEAKALLNFFENNKFDDDDIIVKITGRYVFLDNKFLKYIADHQEYDAFVKYVTSEKVLDMHTACFAMRYKYFLEFLRHLNLEKMEREMICIEWELAYFCDITYGNENLCATTVRNRISCRIARKHECWLLIKLGYFWLK